MIKKIIFFTMLATLVLVSSRYVFSQPVNKKTIIENIMDYPMTNIINRCKKDHGYSDEDMIILEKELKRYLVLSAEPKNNLGTGMYSKDVDNLWHTFLLFTKEYDSFCNTFLNRFIHHVPEIEKPSTPKQLQAVHEDFQAFLKNYQEMFHEELHPIWLLDMCDN